MKKHLTVRERAVRVAEGYAKRRVRETRPNWGPMVGRFLKSTGISFPAAWCMAMWHYIYALFGVTLGGGASVGNFEEWARKAGDIVTRPLRGDLGCWEFTGDGWPDHVFGVVKVLRLGPLWYLKTVEGNTSSGASGSQDDGQGVYVRRRVMRTARVNGATFVRVPDPKPKPKKRRGPAGPKRKAIAKKTSTARKKTAARKRA